MRLTKKFAELIDGIDLSRAKAGERIELSEREARILIAEGWAQPVTGNHGAVAKDKSPRRRSKHSRQEAASLQRGGASTCRLSDAPADHTTRSFLTSLSTEDVRLRSMRSRIGAGNWNPMLLP